MTPPCYTFSVSELVDRVQLDVHGRQRKPPLDNSEQGTTTATTTSKPYNVDLTRDCALLASMVQYSCMVAQPHDPKSPVRCWPVQRLFRRCQDRTGSFTVETTAWEGEAAAGQPRLLSELP